MITFENKPEDCGFGIVIIRFRCLFDISTH